MIIGYDAKRAFQNCSGLGNYSRNTIDLLSIYYPANKYKLFAPKLTDLYKMPDSAQIITPKSGFSQYMSSYWRLSQVATLMKCNKVEIFHGLSHILPYGIEKTGTPSVVTIHDLIFLRFPQFYHKIDRDMYEMIYRSSCQRATKIIAISKQTKIDIIKYFSIDPDKIEVIYQSCNNSFYDKVCEQRKEYIQLKFNLPPKFILCVGTIEKRKNQLAILKAIVKEKVDSSVVFVGKPTDYMKEIEEYICTSGIRRQVKFINNATTDELQAIYQMAEVMVYPSFFEGFGLPVLEAQASGCPVITSDISSLPEAGGDGASYINPDDTSEIGQKIYKILSDEKFKNDLIQKGRYNAEKFGEKQVADCLMKMYKELIQKF